MSRLMKLALVAAAVAFTAQPAAAQVALTGENEASVGPTIEELALSSGYQTVRGVAAGLHTRGEVLSAMRILEGFGDFALAKGAVDLAERAYRDAAWVAFQAAAAAQTKSRRSRHALLWIPTSVRNGFSADAERLVQKAQEAVNSA